MAGWTLSDGTGETGEGRDGEDDGVDEALGQVDAVRVVNAHPRRAVAVAGALMAAGGAVVAARALGIEVTRPSPQRYAARAVALMAGGVEADGASLAQVRAEVKRATAGAKTYPETYPALQLAAKRLGGEHSGFHDPARAREFFAATGSGGQVTAAPTTSTADGITTVVVPALGSSDQEITAPYTRALLEGLRAAAGTTYGYVVDLRGNVGGNVWPMLAGLAPLLTDGPVLSFDSRRARAVVSVDGARVLTNGRPHSRLHGRGQINVAKAAPATPIAVLIDAMTVSSGEAVAIAFIGQHGVRTFGQPTHGFSSANQPRHLRDGAVINLTVAIDADRHGTRYGHPITPDTTVAGADAQMAAARAWLTQQRQQQ